MTAAELIADMPALARRKGVEWAPAELRSYVERYEALAAQRADLSDEQAEIMADAKNRGYSVPALKKLIAIRKRKPEDVAEEEAIVQLYRDTLAAGMRS